MQSNRWVPVLAACVLLGACATADPRFSESSREIAVSGPTVVGYFPGVSEAELRGDPGLSSALEHLEMALEKTSACYATDGVSVQEVLADHLTILSDGHSMTIAPTREPDGIGALLIAPGQAGRVISANGGPSLLIESVPGAASAYFRLPSCDPAHVPEER